MNEALYAVIIQTVGYSISMIIGIGVLSFLLRGFLFKFIKVKASLGRKILVRVREVTHWEYYVGRWEEHDLIIGSKKKQKRINNISSDHIYRSIGISWIDLDGKDWSILPPKDTKAIEGFDPEKMESLIVRALYKPPTEDTKDKIIIILCIGAFIAAAVSAYFGFVTLEKIDIVNSAISTLQIGQVVPTG